MKKICNGFTLVELLVTVAVIAILAALLFPVLSVARDKAKRIQCMNNIRHLGQGATLYASEFNGYLPFPNWAGARNCATGATPLWDPGWAYNGAHGGIRTNVMTGVLWIYLKNLAFYHCPVDLGPWNAGSSQNLSSYMMNGAVCGFNTGIHSYRLADFRGQDAWWWEGRKDMYTCHDLSNHPSEGLCKRHSDGSSLACADGHVEWITVAEWTVLCNDPNRNRLWCSPGSAAGGPLPRPPLPP